MTIYFSGSITGGRDDVALYRTIVDALEREGHRVLAGAVASESVTSAGEAISRQEIYERDVAWVAESDVLVAEVSMPSIGVGFEIALAQHVYGSRVICLWRPAYTPRCSAMIGGNRGIELIEYTDETRAEMLAELCRRLRE